MRRRNPATSGLTLVEVTMATGVLAVLLAGVFAAMASSQRVTILSREYQMASEEAHRQMDVVLGNPDYTAVVGMDQGFHVRFRTGDEALIRNLAPARSNPANATDNAATPGDDRLMAGRVVTAQDVDLDGAGGWGSTGLDLLQVTVTVAWRGADGADQRLSLTSMKVVIP